MWGSVYMCERVARVVECVCMLWIGVLGFIGLVGGFVGLFWACRGDLRVGRHDPRARKAKVGPEGVDEDGATDVHGAEFELSDVAGNWD